MGLFLETVHRKVVVRRNRPTSEGEQWLNFMTGGEVDAIRKTSPRVGHTNPTSVVEDGRTVPSIGR